MKASVCSTGLHKDKKGQYFVGLVIICMFQRASKGPPPTFLLLFCLPSSSSIPRHISPVPSVWRSAADMVDAPSAMNKGSSVPEIKPLDQYDFNRAKICASVRWLLSKSYGSAGTTVLGAVWVGHLIINALHTEIEAVLCHIQWIFQYLNARHLALVMLVANLLYPTLCAQL